MVENLLSSCYLASHPLGIDFYRYILSKFQPKACAELLAMVVSQRAQRHSLPYFLNIVTKAQEKDTITLSLLQIARHCSIVLKQVQAIQQCPWVHAVSRALATAQDWKGKVDIMKKHLYQEDIKQAHRSCVHVWVKLVIQQGLDRRQQDVVDNILFDYFKQNIARMNGITPALFAKVCHLNEALQDIAIQELYNQGVCIISTYPQPNFYPLQDRWQQSIAHLCYQQPQVQSKVENALDEMPQVHILFI